MELLRKRDPRRCNTPLSCVIRTTGPLAFFAAVRDAALALGCAPGGDNGMPNGASCRRSADGAVRRVRACRHSLPRDVPRAEYFWMCAGAMLHWDCRNSPAAWAGYHRGPELMALLKKEGLAPKRRPCGSAHYRSGPRRRKQFFRLPPEAAA